CLRYHESLQRLPALRSPAVRSLAVRGRSPVVVAVTGPLAGRGRHRGRRVVAFHCGFRHALIVPSGAFAAITTLRRRRVPRLTSGTTANWGGGMGTNEAFWIDDEFDREGGGRYAAQVTRDVFMFDDAWGDIAPVTFACAAWR